jgi:hypothetical protein
MPFLPDLLTKLKNSVAAMGKFFTGLPGSLAARFATRFAELREKWARSGGLFRGKRKWLLIGPGAALVLLFFSLAILSAVNRDSRAGPPPAGDVSGPVQGGRIPPEDMFLPGEPDFIPGVLPERERRDAWTVEDAAPYWRDPLKIGEEPWREQVEAAIDELLERVP